MSERKEGKMSHLFRFSRCQARLGGSDKAEAGRRKREGQSGSCMARLGGSGRGCVRAKTEAKADAERQMRKQ